MIGLLAEVLMPPPLNELAPTFPSMRQFEMVASQYDSSLRPPTPPVATLSAIDEYRSLMLECPKHAPPAPPPAVLRAIWQNSTVGPLSYKHLKPPPQPGAWLPVITQRRMVGEAPQQ